MKKTLFLRPICWNLPNFLLFVLSLQIITITSIILDLPVIRQVVGFIYLSFVPGMVILRALKLKESTFIEEFSLSVGLSVSLMMFLGFLLNETFSLMGAIHPLSIVPLATSLIALVSAICAYIYLTEKGVDRQNPSITLRLRSIFWPTSIALIALPFLSIFGSFLVGNFSNNLVLLLVMLVIPFIYILVAFSKRVIPQQLYPLAIVTITLALLLQSVMASEYIMGADIHREFYCFQSTMDDFTWKPITFSTQYPAMITRTYNSMLSITILPTIYSVVMNLNGELIFKFVYPLLFSIVPLVLYEIYSKLIGSRKAILAIFFFISFQNFYSEVAYLARQMIAEVFFALLLLLWIRDDRRSQTFRGNKKAFLLVTFSFALVVSHYTLTYICIFLVFLVWMLTRIESLNKMFVRASNWLQLSVIAFAWYIFIHGSAPFESLSHRVRQISLNLFQLGGGLDPNVLKALGMGEHISFTHDIGRIIFYATEFFILLGFIKLILSRKKLKINSFYFWSLFTSMIIILLSIAIPYLAVSMRMTRIYQILLFFLAPAFVLGAEFFFDSLSVIINRLNPVSLSNMSEQGKYILVSLIIVIYFLFQAGIIFDLTGDVPTSLSLTTDKTKAVEHPSSLYIYNFYTFKADVFGAKWISVNVDEQSNIYSDFFSGMFILKSYGMIKDDHIRFLSNETNFLGEKSYIFLRQLNTIHRIMQSETRETWILHQNSSILSMKNPIYTNKGCEIYASLNLSDT